MVAASLLTSSGSMHKFHMQLRVLISFLHKGHEMPIYVQVLFDAVACTGEGCKCGSNISCV